MLCVIVAGVGMAAVVVVAVNVLSSTDAELGDVCDALSRSVRETAKPPSSCKGERASTGVPLREVSSLPYAKTIRIKTSHLIGAIWS